MRICGVDPGLQRTGYGVVEVDGSRMALVNAGVVRSLSSAALAERLRTIHAGMIHVLQTSRPDLAVFEALYSHYTHPETAILMGHVRGVLLLAAGALGIPVAEYSATHIKKAVTGRGHATKPQIQRMVQMLLNLPAPPEPDDATDALAGAIAYAHTLRAPALQAALQ
ncbi:MAG: crossover junction endodeoxyribonuclease RuvC [Candidatus Omnitrophica bacterium]|nr:crossover junction endodeoxyribonuclease RuvC [Candidatus Omnitrophota bacterium]